MGHVFFLNSGFFSLSCNSFSLVIILLAEVWGNGTACPRWHSRAASQEHAQGVLATCCAATASASHRHFPRAGLVQALVTLGTVGNRKLKSWNRTCLYIIASQLDFTSSFHPKPRNGAFSVCQVLMLPALSHTCKTQCNTFAAVGNSVKFAFFTWIWQY